VERLRAGSRILAQTSNPSIPGMTMSRKITSNCRYLI
jgi:hypothetical protein